MRPRQRLSHRNLSRDLKTGRSPVRDEMAAMARKPDLVKWFAKLDHRRRFCRLDLEFHAATPTRPGRR